MTLALIDKGEPVLSGDKTICSFDGKLNALYGTKIFTLLKKETNRKGHLLGDRIIFKIAKNQYINETAINKIFIIKINDGVSKFKEINGLHELYPIFLDKQREDILFGDTVFDGSICNKKELSLLLKESLKNINVYKLEGSLEFLVNKIKELK